MCQVKTTNLVVVSIDQGLSFLSVVDLQVLVDEGQQHSTGRDVGQIAGQGFRQLGHFQQVKGRCRGNGNVVLVVFVVAGMMVGRCCTLMWYLYIYRFG